MAISFLPGQPSDFNNAVATTFWKEHRLLAYCSGNNLIILENISELLQTIYLPSDGLAVDIHEESGLICVCHGTVIEIFSPVVDFLKPLKWVPVLKIQGDPEHGPITSLSWGADNELLVGSGTLNLYALNDNADSAELIWSQTLANPVSSAIFSYDSGLIASAGKFDKLVKVWHRISYDRSNCMFGFSYLPHPSVVTHFRWRQPFHRSQSIENTLYTLATDGLLRIWSPIQSQDSGNLQLWASIDICAPSRLPVFAVVVDNRDVSKAVESLVARSKPPVSEAYDAAVQLSQENPDLCLVFDQQGKMSAYTICNIDNRKPAAKLLEVKKILTDVPVSSDFPKFSSRLSFMAFANHKPSVNSRDLSLIVHNFSAGLQLFETQFDTLLNPQLKGDRMVLKSVLTGHVKSIQKLLRTADGKAMLSTSRFSENVLWTPKYLEDSVTLQKKSLVDVKKYIHRASIMEGGDYLVTLLDNEIVCWDCRHQVAQNIGSLHVSQSEDPICFLLLPESNRHIYHLIGLYSGLHVNLWEVRVPSQVYNIKTSEYAPYDRSQVIVLVGQADLVAQEDIYRAVRVDPVGWRATVGINVDTFQRDVLATVSSSGILQTWTASVSDGKLKWLNTATVDTGQHKPSLVGVSSIKKVVLTNEDATGLVIWDTRSNLLEFEQTFDASNTVSDLDWASTPDSQSVLGVGFAREVVLYSQLRFDYTHRLPSWAPFKRVDISRYTSHSIGDSVWLHHGTFVVGAGNQFFIQDKKVDETTDETARLQIGGRNSASLSNDIFDVCAVLNGPLPMYHPQLLIQTIFVGKLEVAKKILEALLHALKFGVVLDNSIVDIESTLGLSPEIFRTQKTSEKSKYDAVFARRRLSEDFRQFDQETSTELSEWLQKVSLPYLSRHQQITLVSVIEAIAEVDIQRRSLDENGIRYLIGFRLYKAHRGTQESMTIRDFNWALHSESQDILLELIDKSSSTALLWPLAKDLGLPYWLRLDRLRETFDTLGKNHFSQSNRDPTACSLFYLALKKKQILIGLWRTASWHKEQTKTISLLSNDFTTPRWQSAAKKNAFALLGKHRYEYAACFFLLGDALADAVNVLIRNVQDISLAIAVARVYEGDDGPVLRSIIYGTIIPQAVKEGDRWTTSWALWTLGKRESAVQALVMAPNEVLEDGDSTAGLATENARSFLVEDPVLITLYKYLRSRTLKLLIAAAKLSPEYEFQFVLKTANIFTRMGCDVLGLDLVSGWDFLLDKAAVTKTQGFLPAASFNPGVFNTENSGVSSSGTRWTNNPFGIKENAISDDTEMEDVDQLKLVMATRRMSFVNRRSSILEAKRERTTSKEPNTTETEPQSEQHEKQTENSEQNGSQAKASTNLKPAAEVAFQEPDMSSFDFGR